MKAIRYYRYGPPEVLRLQDVEPPDIGDDGVLVHVRAASVNPADFHLMRGTPYLVRTVAGPFRPKDNGLGLDMAGLVERVGRNVTRYLPGDEVFGSSSGTLAQYVTVRENGPVVPKPANVTYEQAAAVPCAGLTALQALRDKARLRSGQRVLVNGAAGGVGTFAVQIAKAYGAEVTGVCSTRNVEMVAGIGADEVVDYTRDDFTRIGQRYDVILDMVGNHTLTEIRRVLAPKGVLVSIGDPDIGDWLEPLIGLAKLALYSRFVSQSMVSMLSRPRRDDLAELAELLESGKVTPVLDRTYPLDEVPEAIRYLEAGHARGKVVITP